MRSPDTHIIEAKSGLSRALLPETFLVSLYRVNAPYRGCGHGCRYCDGRAEKYYVEGDFERDIAVRGNIAEMVARDVGEGVAEREFGSAAIGSGVTDVYQPLEKELGLTRRILEALVPARIPVVILTKSDLILRDFDVLSRFPSVLLLTTITTVNESRAALLEPGASSPSARLELVRKARAAGFHSGVMAMPMCPGISDTEESFSLLLDQAEKADAEFVYPGGLTLRPGKQKELFMDLVNREFPDERNLYDELYRENRQSGAPLVQRSSPRFREWDRALRTRGIPQMIPDSISRDLLSPPDRLFVLFCHMENLYALRGVDTKPLRAAKERFAQWLKAERTALRRKKTRVVSSDPFPVSRILDEKYAELCASGTRMAGILKNERLARLAASLSEKGSFFDYPTLAVTH